MKLSLKNKGEVSSLSNIINEISNSKKMLSNIVFETKSRKLYLDSIESMSFVVVGDCLVGKTYFLNRVIGKFEEIPLATIGIDKEIKHFKIEEDIMKITLWDTAGQERFRNLPRKYYQISDGIFLLFDITNEETFNNLNKWLKDIKQNIKNDQMPIIYLIGTGIDCNNRVISKDIAEEYAKSHGMKYFEISCLYDINNFEVLNLMILEVYKRNNLDNFRKLMARYKIKIERNLMKKSFHLNKYINY